LADPLAQTPSIAARVDRQLEAVGSNQEDGRWLRIDDEQSIDVE
jgi:hypothetical protein